MPLGLLLVSRGILTPEQLALTLAKQQTETLNLGDAAQRLGFATVEQITAAVASQWSCPVFPISGRTLSIPVRVPLPLLEAFEMLPVHFVATDRRLTIGFVTRVEYQVLSIVERITGCDTVPCFITAPEYYGAIQQMVCSVRDNEIVLDRPMHAPDVARMSRNYLCQLAGSEVRFGMYRENLWIRIWNSRQETDLVFQVEPD
jgi:hypothetical protein